MGTTTDHGPIRTCIGCRARRPQSELVRCVLGAGGTLRIDRRAPGRGAWLCGAECVVAARKRRAFDRAFRAPVAPDAIDRLAGELTGAGTERAGGDRPDPCETESTRKG